MMIRQSAATIPLILLTLLLGGSQVGAQERREGYTDTPLLPGSKWRVHDAARPRPPIVDPGSWDSSRVLLPPPSDALILFDGKDLSRWTGAGGKAGWKVENGYMEVNRTGNLRTKDAFGDIQLHLEWATPQDVKGRSQGRGNSGVYLMGRYEIQILDSFKNDTYPDGQAAAMYGQYPPLVNACRPPGQWQSYDIIFRAPRFEGERLLSPASVTVLHNGVLVHDRREFLGAATHRKLPRYAPHGDAGPLMLQDHGNPVRFRNIWVRPLPPGD